MNPKQPRVQQGFSLLEVLVAFAILSISIGVLMQVFSNSMRAASVSRHYSNALVIAESKLAEASVVVPLQETQIGGLVDEQYRWELTVLPYQPPVEGLGEDEYLPYEVVVRVAWGENPDSERVVQLSTLRLGLKL